MRNKNGFAVRENLLCVNSNYNVNVLDSNVVCALNENEIIVGFNSSVGNLADNAVITDIALAPGYSFFVVLAVIIFPFGIAVLLFVIRSKGCVCVIVDFFCRKRNVLGNVEHGVKVRAVTECS